MNEQVNQIPKQIGGPHYFCTECYRRLNSGDMAYSQYGSKQLICGDCWEAGKRFKQ